ncbi:ABC transporter permease [Microlunatus antarcticus]|uniref:Glycine betaine/proline transport system permease protein n=1 Tax=Microlunatus antarcticus TaxID=53388 RepID=A0A7W5P6T2_9ACTN|nr:glycine betaine/proline transport system permease protein [Microlunatus antarcticus]
MTTTAPARPTEQATPAPAEPAPARRIVTRTTALLAVLVVGVMVGIALQGRATLEVARSDLSPFQVGVNGLRDSLDASRGSSGLLRVLDGVAGALNAVIEALQHLVSDAPPGRPTPEIGWLGVVALAVVVTLAVAGWRLAVLTALVFAAFGTFGYWQESLDTLVVTFVSVVLVLVVGLPLGVWMGTSRRVSRVVTPVLDVMQTLPSFVYLLPVTLFFGIGGAPAVIATFVYAFPPVVRVTAEGIRGVDRSVLEATDSLGTTGAQRLLRVLLPMSRRTVLVGVNQSVMAALSMVTIAAFINSPGLGVPVISALASLDVGTSFTAGVLVALAAVMLDRVTTAAGERTGLMRTPAGVRRRRIGLGAAAVIAVVCVYYSHLYLALARFPTSPDLGGPVGAAAQGVADAVALHGSAVTGPLSQAFTVVLLNPFQALLASSPWWLVAAVLVACSALLAGWRVGVVALVCVGVILAVGIWHEAMVTLATAVVGSLLVVVLALVVGVLMANDRRVDLVVRPVLDTAQTIPAFVYLVPALALFGSTRFTAMVAAVIYGAPVAIKLVCDGIRGVSPTTVEAARSTGATRWQLVTRVQLPMARSSVALAANQGLLYVFAVVVIGGLVGAGGLGYLVVAGFSQSELFGKGVAAGVAIVALAILFDRTTQGWVARTGSREEHQ